MAPAAAEGGRVSSGGRASRERGVYGRRGLRLARGTPAAPELVRALQRNLRRLGYLRAGLDGRLGPETERAVRSLQHDLLFAEQRPLVR